jgi:hypothetical protein
MKYYLITYNRAPLGDSGEDCNSEYNFENACSICGTGAQLSSNLKAKGFAKSNKDFYETLNGDFIISKRLYDLIKKDIPHFSLKPVVNIKNETLDFYHLDSFVILPEFNSESTGFIIDGQCNYCKRNGYFNHVIIGDFDKNIPTKIFPLILVYNKSDYDFDYNAPVLKTWECCGYSNKIASDKYRIGYARPWIIISEELKAIFNKELIKGIKYEEIIIRTGV